MIGVDMSFVTDDEVRADRLFTSFSILPRSFWTALRPWDCGTASV